MNKYQRPNWLRVAELWLNAHFQGQQCMVFFSPDENPQRALRIATVCKTLASYMYGTSFYIHPIDNPDAAQLVHGLEQDTYGFVALWNGQELTTENS